MMTDQELSRDAERHGTGTIGYLQMIADQIHYPDCWDTMAYPTLLDAIKEIHTCNHDFCTRRNHEGGLGTA